MKSYLGIRGPGILYIKDLAAFLSTPAAQRQLAAVRRLSMTCKCFARCEADCVCDHDWTPPAVIALREEVERLRAELALAIDDCRAAQVERDNVRAAYITQIERLRAESQARLDAIESLLNTGIFAGNDAEDAQQHAMSIIDAARKGEEE